MSPVEVERKRELSEASSLRERLVELGYRREGTFVETDTYYSPQHVDYLETIECLRVRQRDGFAEITYKPASDAETHSVTDVISKVETNVRLAGPEQAEAANRLLSCVGMSTLACVKKERVLYRHPEREDVAVAIDSVDSVGSFVETEVTRTDDSGAEILEEIETALGVTGNRVVTEPYRDLVRTASVPT
ncbi:adenylate cyclase, class 2 [Actinopolyspora xinjiangensis]|uniref:Adenylate cyclase, class 2 n=1 Tax=Actinopolyspora xinjiangensis TaxID=405564 RepID=A0A1H0P5M9_9ACTN|nr:class IV adenylate cyclase [Actinopolyspora xinjiangensis]SDP00283.1 adenylate cyclase, class 2 [Actinopolyspora xinjiangensis]